MAYIFSFSDTMSVSKFQLAKDKFVEIQAHHRALEHTTEASVAHVLGVIQRYQSSFLMNCEEMKKLSEENDRLKSELQKAEYSVNDARLTASAEAQHRMKCERELDEYRRLIAILRELLFNSGGSSAAQAEGAHLSRLGE